MTGAFIFLSRDVCATAVFHDLLAVFGVVTALAADDRLTTYQKLSGSGVRNVTGCNRGAGGCGYLARSSQDRLKPDAALMVRKVQQSRRTSDSRQAKATSDTILFPL